MKKNRRNELTASACPFLHSINRRCLDFTSNPVLCSKTLSPCRVYLCLVCGNYFSGKAKKTPAYAHSVEEDHAMFMSMEDNMDLVWMPQGETVHDRYQHRFTENVHSSVSLSLSLSLSLYVYVCVCVCMYVPVCAAF